MALFGSILLLGGCTRAQEGAWLGAGIGALIGAEADAPGLGAGVGAGIGYMIGSEADRAAGPRGCGHDHSRYYQY